MRKGFLFVTMLFGAALFSVQGQSLEELRMEEERAQEEIRITNSLLSKTKTNKKSTESQLKLVQNRIRNRKNIVTNLEKQSSVITNDITRKGNSVKQLEDSVFILRKEYGDMVYNAYKNYKLNNFMVFLFASKDFNDATKRVAYMRRYNQARRQKAAEIESVSKRIDGEISELQGKKEELVKVQQDRQKEINALAKDESEFKTAYNKLNKEETSLSSKVKAQRQQLDELQRQIQKIVADAVRRDGNKTLTAAQEEYISNLSGRFDQNKGRLPYPVRGGVVIDQYGIHPHATVRGITVNNKGINIAADKGAEVRNVFEGEVSQVIIIKGFQTTVFIRHGNYITVYSNLAQVSVKGGDKVALNQTIGRLASTDNSDDNVLHFEIWRSGTSANPTNLNPSEWLRR